MKVLLGVAGVSSLDVLVAVDAGLFEDQGLQVELLPYVPNSPQLAQLASSGDADFSLPGASGFFGVRAADRPVVAVAAGATGTYMISLSDEAIQRLASQGVTKDSPPEERIRALKGLKIATPGPGTNGETVVRSLISAVGEDADTAVEYVAIKDLSGIVAALHQGRVDGIVATPPDSLLPAFEGFGDVWLSTPGDDLPAGEGVYTTLHVASSNLAKDRPEVIKKYAAAIDAAHKLIKKDPSRAAEALGKYLELDPKLLGLSVDSVSGAYAGPGYLDPEVYGRTLDDYNKTAQKALKTTFEDSTAPEGRVGS